MPAAGTARIPGRGDTEPGRANLRHVVTDDKHVRQGIGRALMAHVFDTARAAGRVWMHCVATRTAVPFHTACGFTTIGPVSIPVGPAGMPFPVVEMRRDL